MKRLTTSPYLALPSTETVWIFILSFGRVSDICSGITAEQPLRI
jgi:hypothetical protein